MRNSKKIILSIIAGITSLIMIINSLAPIQVSAVTPNGRQITESDFLKSEDGYLKNKNGDIVALRGVNTGGWLVQESWMCPINGKDREWANLDTINTLKNRGFTDEQIQTLFDTYQDNWFTTYDLDNLQKFGINCVRVPFWYRNFMKDEDGTWITGSDLDNNPGIKRLDWVIEECGKRGMYVILDCHGAPGGQSMDHCCGTLCKNELYDSPKNRAILKDLWTTIANRYKDNPVVAAYDILNEPQNNLNYTGENAWAPGSEEALSRTYSVYDEMYKAIREVDPNHVISMEAIWEGDCLPDPNIYGWSNLLYQMHIYDTSKAMIDTRINELKYFQKRYGVAVYSGEFNCDNFESYAMEQFNEAGISWTTWAYKGSKQSSGDTWFLYVQRIPDADSTVDSYEAMLKKWGSVLQTSNFEVNNNFVSRSIEANATADIPDPIELPQPVSIPCKIEAENYDFMSGIQTESTSDIGEGSNVGHIETNDWIEYYINVPESGKYSVDIRVASQNGSDKGLQIKRGEDVLSTVSIPKTGGWQQWETITTTVQLSEGKQYLQLFANNSSYNINWIVIAKEGTEYDPEIETTTVAPNVPTEPVTTTVKDESPTDESTTLDDSNKYPDAVGTHEAENATQVNFSKKPESGDYYASCSGNSIVGVGQEWINKTKKHISQQVNSTTAGDYLLTLQYCAPGPVEFMIQVNDGEWTYFDEVADVVGHVSPATGGWNVLGTVTTNIELKKGTNTINISGPIVDNSSDEGNYFTVFNKSWDNTTSANLDCFTISKYVDDETPSDETSSDESTTPEESSSDESTTPEESSSDELTTPEESSSDESTTPEESSSDDETTLPDESSSGDELSSNDYTTVVNPSTVAPTTVAPITKKVVTPPSKTKVNSASKKKASKKVKISIKKVKGARGYRVEFGTTRKFKKALVTKYVKKNKVTIKHKKFKNKKKLYVRVKAYKLDGKKKVLAKKWSKVKKVNIRK